MTGVELFFRKNKKVKQNVFYAATKSLTDESGKPLMWELKPLTSSENDAIQSECTQEIPIPGKRNMYRQRLDAATYAAKLLAASVVYPDLTSEALQDSYSVTKPEALVREMVDDVGEYNAFIEFVQEFNKFGDINADIEAVKN